VQPELTDVEINHFSFLLGFFKNMHVCMCVLVLLPKSWHKFWQKITVRCYFYCVAVCHATERTSLAVWCDMKICMLCGSTVNTWKTCLCYISPTLWHIYLRVTLDSRL